MQPAVLSSTMLSGSARSVVSGLETLYPCKMFTSHLRIGALFWHQLFHCDFMLHELILTAIETSKAQATRN